MAFASPEEKFGIPIESRGVPRTLEQNYSMIAGVVYLVGGIIGFFITGFSNFTEATNRSLFGVFQLNPFHNIVHLGVGAFWLLGAFALTAAGNEGLNIAIGGVYAVATVLGFLGFLSQVISVPGGLAGDNFLHLVTALATLILGTGFLRVLSGRQLATA